MDFAIIAAGEGSRLVQEGVKWHKPLIRINGIPLIDRLINVFMHNGAESLRIIVNEQMTDVQEHLRAMKFEIPFHLVVKSTPSSMHSFYEVSRGYEGDEICLTTVDTIFFEQDFSKYIKAFQQEKSDGLFAVTKYVDDEKPLYVSIDENMMINGFKDENDANCQYVSGGIYCLRQNGIRVLEKAIAEGQSRMRNFQRRLITEGLKIKAYPFDKIIDVDHVEDIRKAEEFVNSNI